MRHVGKYFDILMIFCITYYFAAISELVWFNKRVCVCVCFNTIHVAPIYYDILLSVKHFPSELCVRMSYTGQQYSMSP